MKTHKHRRKPTIIIIAGFIFLVPLLLFRGWVRTTAIPGLMDTIFDGSLKNAYVHDFPPVNDRLKAYNLVFDTSKTAGPDCSVTVYKAVRESIGCYISNGSSPLHPDSAYLLNWKQHSRELETYLLSDGWQKEWNAQQPIDEMLDKRNSDASIGVNYSKAHGKNTCILSIEYNPPYVTPRSTYKDRFWATEVCRRYIALFGGY